MLTAYWFQIEVTDRPSKSNWGFGVTAFDRTDAEAILRTHVFEGDVPAITHVTENIRFEDLERDHVRRNMGVMVERGVWFPKGYNPDGIIR
ncbi:hypothetical protein JDO7802_00664 [Jannaschia donghaensis]|uniref:Uncharacterized protein n=1 Tax=Jannaschia donghaensis TaxID=420998 RepID=A0A0M6YFD1_9RHOB|nr:hypothetical protein JDO7802_00664 [Jannaschia donghaensis]